jgi:hypothetical protein
LVFNTGLYNKDLDYLDILPAANRKWTQFKVHILLAQKQLLHQCHASASSLGFDNFTHENLYGSAFNEEDKQNVTTALSSLFSAISSNGDAFYHLVTTN